MELLDALIGAGLDPDRAAQAASSAAAASGEDWQALCRQAERHGVAGIVAVGLGAVQRRAPDAVPPEVLLRMNAGREANLYQFFSILSFTTYALELLQRQQLQVFVLKGLTLSALYPDEGMRRMADADLYVPDPGQFRLACAVLEADGFEPVPHPWDYHREYTRDLGGRRLTLELHIRPAGHMAAGAKAEMQALELFGRMPGADVYTCAGAAVPGLPPEWFALQLLLHMMNHFLAGEFRLSMLCDWVVFWRAKAAAVDAETFRAMLRQCGVAGLARLVTGVCVRHLGMEETLAPWAAPKQGDRQREEQLYGRFFEPPVRTIPHRRVNAVLTPGLPKPVALGVEVHRQMRYRFPRARRLVPLWPVLWTATIAAFLHNNRVLGRAGVRQIIAEAAHRRRILEELALTKKGNN